MKEIKKILTTELGTTASDLAKISLGGIAMATTTLVATLGCKVLCFAVLIAMISGILFRIYS